MTTFRGHRRLAVVLAAVACTVGLSLASAGPAAASCISFDEIPPSPYAFTGTVVDTRAGGYVATVRTADDRTVEVRGGGSAQFTTSVDRTFEPGATYEFHPANGESPYFVSACTRTRVLSGAELLTGDPGETRSIPGISPQPGSRWDSYEPLRWWAASALAGALVLFAGGWLLRRRRGGRSDAA